MAHSEETGNTLGRGALREGEERYRALFESAADALFVNDRSGHILDVNTRACELLGYTRGELLRLTIADLLPPDAPGFLAEGIVQGQTHLNIETVNRHKDGHLVPVEVSGRQIIVGNQAVWLFSVRDIAKRKRLERILAERGAQLARLNQLARALTRSLDVTQIAQAAADKIRAMAGLDAVGIALIDEARAGLMPIYYAGVSDAFAARLVAHKRVAAKFVGQVAAIGYPLVIEDIRADIDLSPRIRRLIADEGLRTIVFFPLFGEGHAQGMLAASYRQVTAVDEATLQMLEAVVGHVGQALTNARLYQREQRRAAEQQSLVDILSIAISSMRLDDMLPALAENAGRLLQADGAFIGRWDEEKKRVIPAAAYGPYHETYRTIPPIPADQPTLARAVLEAGQPIAVYDTFHSPFIHSSFAAQFPRCSLLGLPLIAHGRRLGALLIASNRLRRFTPAEIELGQLAANSIALAIDNAQLLEAEARQRRQAETLRQVTTSLTSSLELDAVLDAVLDQLGRVVAYDSASIQLLRGGGLDIVASLGLPDMNIARQAIRHVGMGTKVQQMIATRRALVIPDTQADPNWMPFPGQEYIRSWIGAPLFERGELVGVLNLDHREAHAYNEETAILVASFAHQAAIAITNARLYQEERDRVAHLAVLNDIVHIASSTLDLDELYQALADNMVRIIGGDECYITRWDEAAQRAIPVAAYGPTRDSYASLPMPAGEVTLIDSVLSAGHPIAVEDVFNSPYGNPQIAAQFSSRSWLALPLIADGRKLGAVLLGFNQVRRFTEEEIARTSRAAELVAVAVAKAQLHDELQQHARSLEDEVATRTQELRVANEQLRSLDRLKSHLITQISHEFRTPLANLTTYLQLLASGRPEKRDAYVTVLREQTDVLTRLIQSVTAFAEVDLSPDARPAQPWPIADAIQRVVAMNRSSALSKSVRIDVDQSGINLLVRANPSRLNIALDEILSNAVAYTDEGGWITIVVEKIEEDRRGWVRVSVSDTGVGIPADELPHVFDQFFRGRQRVLQVRGIGMGLSLVQAITEAEGGRVTAESAGVGQGSTFRLWLPAAE